jgi:galactose-1-phosphate uridylyltransferase
MSQITDLEELVAALPHDAQALFNRFYRLELATGTLKVPVEMVPWVNARFGAVERVEAQRIVSIKNRFTGEHSLFNQLRTERPIEARSSVHLAELEEKEHCLFCQPETSTPADAFGRITGNHCITASNIAKYDALHSLVIFKEHNPLLIQEEWLADYLSTAERWFEAVTRYHGYPALHKFFLWNGLWRSGASIIHGHMQLTATSERYGRLALFEQAMRAYNRAFNGDYLADLIAVHEQLGLARQEGRETILCYLTPVKEKELVIVSSAARSEEMAETLYAVLQRYLKLGVQSFNLAIFQMNGRHIVRLVDRGSLADRNSDIGAMELYAASVIASDPLKLAKAIFE